MNKSLENSAKLMRELLASVDIEELYNLKKEIDNQPVILSKEEQEEKREKSSDAELFYKNTFEKELKIFILLQLTEGLGKLATDDLKLQFARGTLNGLFLVKDWFEDQARITKSKPDKNEDEESIGELEL